MSQFVQLAAGEPAPPFTQRSISNPRYSFDSAAGRYLMLLFYNSASRPEAQAALAAAAERGDLFNDSFASFFGISNDPADETDQRVANRLPGFRHIWDFDLQVGRQYGALTQDGRGGRILWVLVDPSLRIIGLFPGTPEGSATALDCLARQLPPGLHTGIALQAPILFLPRVFEPELCRRLVDLYEAQGGEQSGFMLSVDGKTVARHDPSHKVRRDVLVEDAALIAILQNRILRRVVPEIAKAHQFHVTRMERYLVACYDAEEGGHFGAHRDNTTPGTAHRRFAVSINLNDAFEGGRVSFPEYGPQDFKAPVGGAVVFSCSLLHAVSKVTAGKRFAFLPFLYDDAAAKIREANQSTIVAEAPA